MAREVLSCHRQCFENAIEIRKVAFHAEGVVTQSVAGCGARLCERHSRSNCTIAQQSERLLVHLLFKRALRAVFQTAITSTHRFRGCRS